MNPANFTHAQAQASADALLEQISHLHPGNYFHCLLADLYFSELCTVAAESWLAGLPVSIHVSIGEATEVVGTGRGGEDDE